MSSGIAHVTGVLALGLLQPRASIDETFEALRATGPDEAARLLVRHKVRRIARRRIAAALAGPAPVPARELRDLDAKLTGGAPPAGGLLARLREENPDLPVRLMKGLAVRDWYPADLPRDVGDADLWVPDAGVGWRLAGALRDVGYDYEPGEMPWLKRDLDGTLFGQIRLLHPSPDEIAVDIHIGPYSVRYCALLVLSASAGQPNWAPLAVEDNLCGVIGNAAGDCFIDAKTVNDLVLAVSRPVDLGYVADTVRAGELSGFLNALVDTAGEICALRDEQAGALRRLRHEAPAEQLDLAASTDRDARTRLVIAHARRMAQRLTGDADAAEQIALDARQAYEGPRRFRLRVSGGRPMRLPAMNPWTCVRLAPQPLVRKLFGLAAGEEVAPDRCTPLAPGLELYESPAGDLVRYGDDVFLPTLDYLFCRRLVQAVPAG